MFGEILKSLLIENNLSQTELANNIGYSQCSVSKWINNKAEPTLTVVSKCAVFFEVSADYLLGLEDETGAKI